VYNKGNYGSDKMLVYGKNILKELDYKTIKKIYINPKIKDSQLIDLIKKNHLPHEFRELKDLDKMVTGLHQGVVIDINEFEYKELNNILDDEFIIILDHLEDPHNFGAIIRTCEAAGVKSIIIPKDRSVRVNDTVMKTSAGALSRINIIQVTNIHQTIIKLQEAGFFCYATDMEGTDYKSINYNHKKVLIIGNEGKGVSPLIKKVADETLTIPMRGKINSLNASVAAAILIFEMN